MEKTDNEIIAEFMGIYQMERTRLWSFPPSYNENMGGAIETGDLRYHTSWDWLKPVVDKILTATSPKEGEGWSYEYLELEKTRIGNSIEYVYARVIQFIKWYSTQPKQNGN